MKTIWKIPLHGIDATHNVDIPAGSKLLHVNHDPAAPWEVALWFEIETSGKVMSKRFTIVPTGGEIPTGAHHIGTALCGAYVWHVYELRNGG